MARWVAHTVTRPMHCSGFPGLGARHPKGYWDMGVDLDREHVYWSVEGVEDRARAQGWTSPEDTRALRDRVAELEAEKVALEAAHADLEQRFAAIDVLASAGFVARKKPGRPKEAVA